MESEIRRRSQGVACRCHRVIFFKCEAPLGLFKFISDYFSYFEKINLFFNIIAKNLN
jgi:hypothetical protein